MPGNPSSPLKDATARLRVLRRENRAAGKEGKFSADENQQARKALEAEGVEKSIAGKALKALTRKQ